MYYSEEKIDAARHIKISHILDDMSEKYIRCGKEFYWKTHDSVKFHDGVWYQHSAGIGGSAVEFCQTFLNMNFRESMDYLSQRFLGGDSVFEIDKSVCNYKKQNSDDGNKFILRPQLPDMMDEPVNVIEYLTKERGISRSVVLFFIAEKSIMETSEYRNVAFIGRNTDSEIVNIHLRSCTTGEGKFRQTVKDSDSHYGFSYFGKGDTVYAFEAPIDMLSFISLYPDNWMQNSYVALNGLSGRALCRALEEHKNLNSIVLCLDNDKAGNEACTRLEREVRDMGYGNVIRFRSSLKDWNEDLLEKEGLGSEVNVCHQLQF